MSPPSGLLNRGRRDHRLTPVAKTFRHLRGWTLGVLHVQGLALEAPDDQRLALGARGVARCHNDKKLRQQVSREAAAGFSHGRKPMEKPPLNPAPKGRQEKPTNWIPD